MTVEPTNLSSSQTPSNVNNGITDDVSREVPIQPKAAETHSKPKPKENLLLNLLLNLVIPSLVLSKLSGEEHLGTQWALVVALAFPIAYGVYDFYRAGRINFFAALGFTSTLLTGGIGLLELDPKYIAIKEAAIPAVLALATLISLKTPYPLIKTLLFNEMVVNTQKINSALQQHGNEGLFQQRLKTASLLVAFGFTVSSVLNYALARYLVISPAGTEAFNEELAKMNLLSYPVIAVPVTIITMGALIYLFRSVTKLTQLRLEEIMNDV